ncbi:MAG: phosphate acyltransferase PlsX [Candidatus Omnitrophica bacterium]|nr:phosphate acyltransferase PlsX [Candidatus Omnitrophota bacterium]
MAYRIGLDISGGDRAPDEIIKGAILARKELGYDVVLVGVKQEIQDALTKQGAALSNFEIVHAPEKIEMAESPAASCRKKKNSSIVIGAKLLKEKKIDAFVSCGNTGAVVCASTLALRLIEGVERPGIGLMMPNPSGISLVVDVGANIDPKPIHLFQYGIMASVYYNLVLDKENPTVGLLNIGEEASKGNDFTKSVHKSFTASSLNFTGNLEAKDLFSGKCDCVVCDGFAGNIALKVSESCATFVAKFLLETMKSDFFGIIGLLLAKRSLKKFKKMIDYAEYGGAPLLGVDGVVIIGHGRSNARAVKNAIKVAGEELKRDLIAKIKVKVNEVCQNQDIKQILNV